MFVFYCFGIKPSFTYFAVALVCFQKSALVNSFTVWQIRITVCFRSLRLTENQLEIFDGADLRIFTKLVELDLRNNNLTCIASGRSFRMRWVHLELPTWRKNVCDEVEFFSKTFNRLSSSHF